MRTWSGKTVLLVDDDARNIFALSSVLERRGMKVLTATTGNEAISLLDSTPDVAIVLMDIMMPEMDGYQTMQVIRGNSDFRRLPIIALTAKAMKGDRRNAWRPARPTTWPSRSIRNNCFRS
jgi:CheY-like chemotaxis protein